MNPPLPDTLTGMGMTTETRDVHATSPRESEERLRLARQVANEGFWDWNLNTQTVYFDPRYYLMAGYAVDEFPHRLEEFQLRVHPDDLAGVMTIVENFLKGQAGRCEAEFRFRKKPGDYLWIHSKWLIVEWDEQGKPARLVGTHADITERKQTEELLLRQHEMLARTERIAHLGSWEWEIETDQVRWSEELFRIFQRDPARGAPSYAEHPQLYVAEDMARLREVVDACVSRGTPYEVELRAIRADGTLRHCIARGQATYDSAGRIVRLVGSFQDITERKQAETALRESREEYLSLFQSVQVGLVVHAPDTRILFSNPMASQLLGLTPDQMRGKTAIDEAWRFIREDGTPLPLAEYPVNQALATHQPFTNLTLGILRPDREGPIWVQCNTHQDRGIDGHPQRVVVMFADITAHKQSEEALRQNHAMLDTILNAIPQSVFWKDRDSRYLGCNARFAEAVGLQSPHEIVGKTDFDLPWPREEAEAYRADDRQVMAYNSPKTHIVEPLQQADGSRIWIDTTKIPLRDGQGRVHGILGVFEDITTRKQVEERLRDSEERFKRVSLVISDFAYSCRKRAGQDYQIDWLTGAIERISGYSADEILAARCWRFLVLAEDQPLFAQGVTSLMPGESATRELRIRHKDGTVRWLQSSAQCLTDSDDPADHLIYGGCLDITERKRAEEALRETHHRLEKVLEIETVGIMFWDFSSGRLVDANDTFLGTLGYSRREMEAGELTWRKLTPPEYHERSLAQLELFRERGRIGPYEKEYLRKDGTRQWFLFAGSSLGGDACVEFCVDISERKRTEAALREAEQGLRREKEFMERLLDVSEDTIFVFEPDTGKPVRWNNACRKITGYSDEEIASLKFPDTYYSQEELVLADEAIQKMLRNGSGSIELTLLTKDGKAIPFEYSGSLVPTQEGEPRRFISIGRDITERQRIEAELQRKLGELQQWYEVMLGREGRVLELKHEADSLRQRLGEPPHYAMELAALRTAEADAGEAATTPPIPDPSP